LLEPRRGTVRVFKRPSTPHDQSEGIVAGIEALLAREGVAASAVKFLAHGTTVATNALLERRVAPVGLLTTEGFRDVLELGRQVRPDIYDLSLDKPPVLVPGPWRLEVRERIGADGAVVTPLDEAQARGAIRRLRDDGAQAIAVCLLHSYANPAHEQRLVELIREEAPTAYVSRSSAVMPEFREFERWSSAVLNSALGPVIRRYFRGLSQRVEALALPAAPQIMRSNGGIMSVAQAEALPISLLLSGPAAGVVGASWVARQAGFTDIVTFDMGGTSTDVSLVRNGEATLGRVRRLAGYEVKQPMVDVHSIGAGGGSIARVDQGGFVQVGPESAGAVPGPAAYGLGGELPTVTDANVLTGRLGPGGLLGGTMALAPDRAERAVAKHVAERVEMRTVEAALGILAVVNAAMLGAIRRISIERGHDPRRFTLVAFGGAGPLHAARLARALGMPSILVPNTPASFRRWGSSCPTCAPSCRRHDPGTRATDAATLETIFRPLEQDAAAWLARERVPSGRREIARAIDMRYVGQNHELTVPMPAGRRRDVRAEAERRFAALHRQVYGHGEMAPTEMITFRVFAIGHIDRPQLASVQGSGRDRPPTRQRAVWLPSGRRVTCPVIPRDALRAGQRVPGPAVIEQMDTTTLVLDGQVARLDRSATSSSQRHDETTQIDRPDPHAGHRQAAGLGRRRDGRRPGQDGLLAGHQGARRLLDGDLHTRR
jgi:N-methylhydantoinase A